MLKDHKYFREDDLTRRDTRLIIRRYLSALKNIGEKEPETYPFKDWMKGPQDEFAPDPFDQLEMTRTRLSGAPTSTNRPK